MMKFNKAKLVAHLQGQLKEIERKKTKSETDYQRKVAAWKKDVFKAFALAVSEFDPGGGKNRIWDRDFDPPSRPYDSGQTSRKYSIERTLAQLALIDDDQVALTGALKNASEYIGALEEG